MKHGCLTLIAAAAGAAFASTAAAQVTSDTMLKGRPARTVDIQAHARVEHDTNIARTSSSLAAQRGIKPADTLYSPELTVDIVNPIGQQAIFLRGTASYLFHDKNQRLDHSRFDLTGGLGGSLGPCGSVVSAGYSRGRSEREDLTLVTTVENILEVKRAAFSLTCARPPGIGAFVTVGKDWGDNSLLIATNGDYETVNVLGGLRYSRPSAGSVGLVGAYTRTEYTNRIGATGGTEGFEMTGGGIELERRIGGRIQAAALATYSHVDLLTPIAGVGKTDFDGFTYSGNISFRASSRLRLEADLERQVTPTLVRGQAFEVQTNYQLRGDYRIGSRFTLGAQARQRKVDSRGAAIPVAGVLTESRTRVYSGSLTYQQSKQLSFMLTAQREKRTADNPQFNYNSERYGVSADYSF